MTAHRRSTEARGLRYIARLAAVLLQAAICANASAAVTTQTLRGAVGKYPVGASMIIQDHAHYLSGHYYYASQLKDIPLRGRISGGQITLAEPSGGIFHLRFTHRDDLVDTLDNATELKGTWERGDTTLPVSLNLAYSKPGHQKPWYAMVTRESDAAFENRVRAFINGIVGDRPHLAARYVSYPMRVNTGPGKGDSLRSPQEFIAYWPRLRSTEMVNRLKQSIPHEMFVRNGSVMVANGLVWFDARGATAVNLP